LKYIPKLRNIVVVLSLYSVEVQVVNPRITRRNVTKWACIHTITVKISVYTEWSTSKPFVSVARQHALAYTARYCYIVFTVCPTRWGIVPIDECTYRRNLSTTRCAIIPVFHPQYRRYNRGGSPFVRTATYVGRGVFYSQPRAIPMGRSPSITQNFRTLHMPIQFGLEQTNVVQ